MPAKHISQREARRLKRQVIKLERELRAALTDRDVVVERRSLTNWDMGVGSKLVEEVRTIQRLNYRVEVEASGDATGLRTYAVRRKDQIA